MARARNLVGVKFHYNFADSRPEWIVEKKRGRGAWECRVTETSPDWAGRTKVFGTEEIESALAYDEMISTIGKNNGDWWASRKVGQIVHYHDAFGRYVRGVIVNHEGEMKMQPTALVGNWTEHDLPKRLLNGTVRWGYHAEKIRNPGPDSLINPHQSNMWESPEFSRKGRPDPTRLPAHDLSEPPQFEGEKAEFAHWESMRQRLGVILGEGHHDPKAALQQVRDILAAQFDR